MQIPDERDIPADQPEPVASIEPPLPAVVADEAVAAPVAIAPIEPADPPIAAAPDDTIEPFRREVDDGAAQRRITMQLYTRMVTDLRVLTGDQRVPTDDEINEALHRAVRALGLPLRPQAPETGFGAPSYDGVSLRNMRPYRDDAAIATDRAGAWKMADFGTASFDDGRGAGAALHNASLTRAMNPVLYPTSVESFSPGQTDHINAQLPQSTINYSNIKLGPKDIDDQENIIPFDGDIIEGFLPSKRRVKEVNDLFNSGEVDKLISKYFVIENSKYLTSDNPLGPEAERNLRESLKFLMSTSVGRRLVINMASQGARQKIILSPVGETGAVSGKGSDILFNFRQIGESSALSEKTPALYRTAIVIAHELGHSILGYLDPLKSKNVKVPKMEVFLKLPKSYQKKILDLVLPKTMGENVQYVENAIRAELKIPPRKSYVSEARWRPLYEAYTNGK